MPIACSREASAADALAARATKLNTKAQIRRRLLRPSAGKFRVEGAAPIPLGPLAICFPCMSFTSCSSSNVERGATAGPELFGEPAVFLGEALLGTEHKLR